MPDHDATGSWSYLAPYRRAVVFGSFATFVNATLTVAVPYFMGRGIDALASGPRDHAAWFALIAIGLVAVQTFARSAGFILLQNSTQKAEHDLRTQVFAHLMRTDLAYLRTQRTGDLVSRLSNDLSGLSTMWGGGLQWAIGMGALVSFSVAFMIEIDPLLAMLALAPVVVVIFLTRMTGNGLRRVAADANRTIGKLSSVAHEDLAGIGVVKGYQLEGQRTQQFAELSRQLVHSNIRYQLATGALRTLLAAFGAFSVLLILWVGGKAVIDGDMRLGELIQFNIYLGLLSVRVVGLGGIFVTFQRGATCWTRLAEVLTRPPAIRDSAGPGFGAGVRGELELRDLTILIGHRKLLDGVSLRIPANTLTAIVGRVGAGKTTLVEAIPRLLDVPPNSVFVDGRDVTELPIAELRRAIAYAPQTAFLFSASIADNIAFGLEDPGIGTRDQVIAAARAAGLEPDLAVLPDGIDTQVGELGITLSGGQRQRVALARALVGMRPITILDDSLSAVDTETERRVLDKLDEMLRHRTVIMISHRVEALRRADQIVVLDGGRVVETGVHAELLARGGPYADLYRIQLDAEAA